jgi:putative protease
MTPEILAPAQDAERLIAAVEAGADAVYVGIKTRKARRQGADFTMDELARAVAYCRQRDVKVYVALNTVIKERELPALVQCVAAIGAQGAHGIIVQDLGAAALVKEVCPDLTMHASTQLAVHNIEGVREAARFGFSRVALARELTAFEVREIALDSPVELELFVHGSLCYSMSGLCLTSSFLGGLSGNRGWCTQACRRPYLVRGAHRYPFSMADLSCALGADLLRSLPVAAWVI